MIDEELIEAAHETAAEAAFEVATEAAHARMSRFPPAQGVVIPALNQHVAEIRLLIKRASADIRDPARDEAEYFDQVAPPPADTVIQEAQS